MPAEVWNMQELQHIEVWGKDLPTPDDSAVALDRLSSLIGVTEKSCTREILKRIPNLNALRIEVELQPYDEDEDDDDRNSLSNLGYISEELQKLGTLKYDVMNPDMKRERMVPLSMFPSSLRSLHLNGLGCPWEHLNDIGSMLPNLVDLTLHDYAFRSPKWNIESGSFLKLEKVVIEDTDLVQLIAQHGSLPMLELLSIRHCYKLQQLEWTCDPSKVKATTIELVDCNPLAVASAKKLRPESVFKVLCHSSF
ncbi:uncharacterized protein LOC121747829 [Salvia splendens]|uniref:uncharacterized protein LOC121747829 n=1 Tax=Salvia splendens TaxID=180675 RepID=UPI001C27BBA0|nr:uncharacterized protein LOC121747829 [Salvia splendens]